MTEKVATLLSQVRELSVVAKIRLVECILPELESALSNQTPVSRRQWKGIFGDTGPVPGEADIEEMRREAWPRS